MYCSKVKALAYYKEGKGCGFHNEQSLRDGGGRERGARTGDVVVIETGTGLFT